MNEPKITPALVAEHGLKSEEYERISNSWPDAELY